MVVVCWLLTLYWLALILAILSSWFRIDPFGPWARVVGVLRSVTEPVLRPLRAVIPPVRIGGAAIDLSPIIVFILLGAIRARIC